jgi:hypothetical protein
MIGPIFDPGYLRPKGSWVHNSKPRCFILEFNSSNKVALLFSRTSWLLESWADCFWSNCHIWSTSLAKSGDISSTETLFNHSRIGWRAQKALLVKNYFLVFLIS